MADVVVTAANVLASSGAQKKNGTLGATATAGQAVYRDASDGKMKLADANLSAAAADVRGILLTGGADGQPCQYIEEDDDFTPGFTVTVGTIYVLSGTAGGIAPAADLATGMYPAVLMIGKSATKVVLKIVKGGVVVPA
jgi:hypothetical protein